MGLKRIITPLDIHLDTRLGTIARLNPAAAEYLLSNNEYWLRENDFWGKLTNGMVSDEEFKKAYAERGGENTYSTISASIRSNIAPFLLRLLTDDHVNRLNQMGDAEDAVSLTINYWPYTFNSEEIEWLRDIMHEIYSTTLDIEFVSISMEDLTPALLNENFAACVMYDFHDWIKMHAVELGAVRLNCFNFISPKIFEQDVSNVTVEEKQSTIAAFRMQKLIHMDFEFIDAKYFSVLNIHGK